MGEGNEVRPLRVEPFQTVTGWYFRLLAANGEIIAQSECYASEAARDETMRLISSTPIVIVDEASDG